MAANESLKELSTTDGDNSPAGSAVIGSTLDDELRSNKANIARAARMEFTATISAGATLADTMLNKVQPVDESGGNVTVTLPAISGDVSDGWQTTVINVSGTNNVLVGPTGSIVATLSATLQAVTFGTDGTVYRALSENRSQRPISTDDFSAMSASVTAMAAADLALIGDASDSNDIKTQTLTNVLGLVPSLGLGVVEYTYDVSTVFQQTTESIPLDDTIPQVTEGVAVVKKDTITSTASAQMSLTVVPSHASNVLIVEFTGFVGQGNVASGIFPIFALFEDGGANAVYATVSYTGDNQATQICGKYVTTAASTSSREYTLRFGNHGGSSEVAINGDANSIAGRELGGVAQFVLSCTEIRSSG